MQVGRLGGEDLDALGQVSVRGRPRYSEPGPQQGFVLALAEPDQNENGLVEAGQRPRARACTEGAALGGQQSRQVAHQFLGHVEHGTIGNHVEPSP